MVTIKWISGVLPIENKPRMKTTTWGDSSSTSRPRAWSGVANTFKPPRAGTGRGFFGPQFGVEAAWENLIRKMFELYPRILDTKDAATVQQQALYIMTKSGLDPIGFLGDAGKNYGLLDVWNKATAREVQNKIHNALITEFDRQMRELDPKFGLPPTVERDPADYKDSKDWGAW